MDFTFCRYTVRLFSASPLRNTSLCFFDAQRFPSVAGHVALTIDDAPGRLPQACSRIPDVADLLRARGARASFFLMGGSVRGHEADLVRLVREGHELCNHAVADRPYHEDSPEEFAAAVDSCNEQIKEIQRSAGVPACARWFRAPHGKYTESMEDVLHERLLTNTMCDCYASDPVVEDGEWIGNFLARRAVHGSTPWGAFGLGPAAAGSEATARRPLRRPCRWAGRAAAARAARRVPGGTGGAGAGARRRRPRGLRTAAGARPRPRAAGAKVIGAQVMGPRQTEVVHRHEGQPSGAAPAASAPGACGMQQEQLNQCFKTAVDASQCQFYLDSLKACQQTQ
ncbi:unnamed protein product [Prorocentrum cordatum]|uniref:NodB homology domain-containing protein n=1 Tax=Prorocentrum cordatum TaxID=2364126 RepID=A0ABN9V4R7_9DINO|nr:unnamed protein product [Polarella glacialis]